MDDEILAAITDRNCRGVLFLGRVDGKNDTNPTWINWCDGDHDADQVLVVTYDRNGKDYTKIWRQLPYA